MTGQSITDMHLAQQVTPVHHARVAPVDHHQRAALVHAVHREADLLADRGKGFVYSYLLVPEDTERAGVLRRWLARLDAEEDMTVVVSHDRADVDGSGLAEYGPP